MVPSRTGEYMGLLAVQLVLMRKMIMRMIILMLKIFRLVLVV